MSRTRVGIGICICVVVGFAEQARAVNPGCICQTAIGPGGANAGCTAGTAGLPCKVVANDPGKTGTCAANATMTCVCMPPGGPGGTGACHYGESVICYQISETDCDALGAGYAYDGDGTSCTEPVCVPAVSTWGAIVFGLVLVTVGTMLVRRNPIALV